MLVVSLRVADVFPGQKRPPKIRLRSQATLWGVNFGFWSHLGWSGQNAIIHGRKGLL